MYDKWLFFDEEYINYLQSMKAYRDLNNANDFAFKKGEEKGREKGLAEGRKEGIQEGERMKAIAIARALKSKGIAVDIISDASGLTPTEIASL